MRKAHTFLVTATMLAGGAIGLLAGCTTTHAQGFGEEDVSTTHRLSRAHVLPMNKPGMVNKKQNQTVSAAEHKQAAAAGAQLTYQGGPLLQAVKVYVVFWGTGQDSTVTSGIGQYFSTITNSVYFDWLSEYDANGMSIGRGSYAGSYQITPSVTGSTIDDSQIGPELDAQVSAGKLPAPDANTLYMTYFPPGVTITMGGSQSCVAFCAYHSTISRSTGGSLYYGVLPDLGGACAGGCYGNDIFTSNTVVSSHEMIEAVTDPGVGIGDIGWYDNTNGEIGDICVGQGGTIDNYSVQLEWSNANNACIDQAPGGGSSSGGSSSGSSSGGSSSSSSGSGSSGGSSSSGSGSSGGSSSSGSSGGSSSGSSGGSTSSSGGGSSGGGACAPEQEPHDTPDYADDLSGGCISGNVDPGSDVDFAAFQLSDGQTYDVSLAPSDDANVVLYKWVGYWGQVQSTSPTEIQHTSQGGGYYLTEVWSPGQATQSYQLTLTVQ